MENRNQPMSVEIGDILTCFKNYGEYKKGKKYRVTAIDMLDNNKKYVQLENSNHWIEKIDTLYQLLNEIKTNKFSDVVDVLKVTVPFKENETYLEDIFTSLKDERKKKLQNIFNDKPEIK